jgi:hypothetical protein
VKPAVWSAPAIDRLCPPGGTRSGPFGRSRRPIAEEIDFARRGHGASADYGWNIFEGGLHYKPGSAAGAIKPVLVARHSDGYRASIGRDRALRSLYGRYLFGDHCKPQISSVVLSSGRVRNNHATGLSVGSLAAFGQDSAGRIYAVSLAGPVYRFVHR